MVPPSTRTFLILIVSLTSPARVYCYLTYVPWFVGPCIFYNLLLCFQVTADDTFPLWMCSNCVRKLNEATDFIHMWAESQATLEKSFIEELLKIGFTNDRVQVNYSIIKLEVHSRSHHYMFLPLYVNVCRVVDFVK